jgi:hypothetical protein
MLWDGVALMWAVLTTNQPLAGDSQGLMMELWFCCYAYVSHVAAHNSYRWAWVVGKAENELIRGCWLFAYFEPVQQFAALLRRAAGCRAPEL